MSYCPDRRCVKSKKKHNRTDSDPTHISKFGAAVFFSLKMAVTLVAFCFRIFLFLKPQTDITRVAFSILLRLLWLVDRHPLRRRASGVKYKVGERENTH
jgi:hypothetical protein